MRLNRVSCSTILFISAALISAPAAAVQDRMGRLGTLPHGHYICSLPGDASGTAWVELPAQNFTISNSSTYRNDEGTGTYLLTGARVTFTSGPMKGSRYQRTGSGKLQEVESNGALGRTRCVRRAGTR